MGFEWYTLDNSLRRSDVVEGFKSFIWSERYSAYGDCQIITKSTFENRQQLTPGTRLGMNLSRYVMTIDTVDDSTAEDGTRLITATGKSLEALLQDRVVFNILGDTTTHPNWIISAKPGDVIREMFNQVCVNGIISQQDTIPFYHLGTLIGSGNLIETTDIVVVAVSPGYLYDAIKQLADQYALGFRLIKYHEHGEVYFEVYVGSDLTSSQVVKPPVIFDPNMDNLEKVSLLTSTAALKTVAYVYAQNGSAMVYGPNSDSSAAGSDRRVLLVNSSNSDPAGASLTDALHAEGVAALASQRLVYAFDGELPQTVPYVYGKDYNLGDLVEERNSDGFGNQMIVTEQIFSSDDAGERSYPTLTLYQGITPGTWLSEDPTLVWDAVDPTLVWDNA